MPTKTIVARVASSFTIVALMFGVLSPIFAIPLTALAVSPAVLQITCDAVVQNGNLWTFSGTFNAQSYPGNSNQYDAAVFSPAGTVADSSSKDAPDTFVLTLDTNPQIQGTWANTVEFLSVPTSVSATLYHQAVPGNESSGDATCVFVIPPSHGGLLVQKSFINDNGGTAATTSFSFTIPGVNGGAPIAFEADGQNDFTLTAGAYTVTEVAATGYAPSYSVGCAQGVTAGATTTCTIVNNDIAPSLTLNKVVDNHTSGGTAVESDWTLTATGPSTITGPGAVGTNDVVSGPTFKAGTYTLSESAGPAGYSAGTWSCTNGITVNGSNEITLGVGQTTVCSITNTAIAPKLTVTKVVTTDNGGTKVAGDFTLLVDLATVLTGIQNIFSVGSKVVSEVTMPGYTGTISGNCAADGTITLALGDIKSCTITNDDDAPALTLIKSVVGGPNFGPDWTLFATGPTSISGTTPVNSNATFSAGTYTLSEVPGGAVNAYYVAGPWVCTGTGSQTGDSIALDPGETATCTITNTYTPPVCDDGIDNDEDGFTDADDIGCESPTDTSESNENTLPLCTDGSDNDGDDAIDLADSDCSAFIPQLTVVKTLINDSNVGGTKAVTDFSFQINGGTATAFDGDGSVTTAMSVGSYSVTEVAAPGYTTTYSTDCTGDLAAGQTKTCTITNDDMPTTLTVVKTIVLDSGKSASYNDFSFIFNDAILEPYIFDEDGVTLLLAPGTYDITESTAPGFTTSYDFGELTSCQDITLELGDTATCTITNDDIPACSDGLDNDLDGTTDQNDPGCHTDLDPENSESYNPDLQSEGNESTQDLCSDSADNDGDELVDLADPDCEAFVPPPPPPPQNGECNDGIDNEGDTLIDQQDPQCFTNGVYSPTNAEVLPSSTGGGGGITGLGGGSVLGASAVGEVLGVSCGVYMDKYVRLGKRNNASQVSKLQEFLNKYMGASLPLTGFYGPLTAAAVNAFQTKHADTILAPWGISTPTGIVYRTTLRQINVLECPEISAGIPELIEWSKANDPAKPE